MAFPVDEAGPSDPFAVQEESPSAFEIAKSYKNAGAISPNIPIGFEDSETTLETFKKFLLIIAKVFEDTCPDQEILSVYAADSLRKCVTLFEEEGNLENFQLSVQEFCNKTYDYLENDESLKDITWFAQISDSDPQILRENTVSEVSKLEAVTKLVAEKGPGYLIQNDYLMHVMRKFTILENDLAIDYDAQKKDLYQEAIKPLFLNHALPRILSGMQQSNETTNQVSSDALYILSTFYGSITYIRRCFKEQEAQEYRETMLQLIRNSDLEEAAMDLDDLTPDSKVPELVGHVAAFAYVLSAEEEFADVIFKAGSNLSKDALEKAVFDIIKKDFPHVEDDDVPEIRKGRVSMLFRLNAIFELAREGSPINVKRYKEDVRYREAFDMMNDLSSDEKFDGFIGSMTQQAVEKYLVAIIREFQDVVEAEDMAQIWNVATVLSGEALYYHSAFDAPISLSVAIFTDVDVKNEWFRQLYVFVGYESRAKQIESKLFHNVDLETISFDYTTYLGLGSFVVAASWVLFQKYQEYRKSTKTQPVWGFLRYLVFTKVQLFRLAIAGLSSTQTYFGLHTAPTYFRAFFYVVLRSLYDPLKTELVDNKTRIASMTQSNAFKSAGLIALGSYLVIGCISVYAVMRGGNKFGQLQNVAMYGSRKQKIKNYVWNSWKTILGGLGSVALLSGALYYDLVSSNKLNTALQILGVPTAVGYIASFANEGVGGVVTAAVQNTVKPWVDDSVAAILQFLASNTLSIVSAVPLGAIFYVQLSDVSQRTKNTIEMIATCYGCILLGSQILFFDFETIFGEQFGLDYDPTTNISGITQGGKDYQFAYVADRTTIAGGLLTFAAVQFYSGAVSTIHGFWSSTKQSTRGIIQNRVPLLEGKKLRIARAGRNEARRSRIDVDVEETWFEKAKRLGVKEIDNFVQETEEFVENFSDYLSTSIENIKKYQDE